MSLHDALQARDELKDWLCRHAYPLWWDRGADRTQGGFHERLGLNGEPLTEPRRARVQPRQMYAYSLAGRLGWNGPARQAIEHGLEFFLTRYRRSDGLFRTLVTWDGRPADEEVLLYDQAFALLGFAAACSVDAGRDDLRTLATDIHNRLREEFRHPVAGFHESPSRSYPLSSNSHMHLLEASLAWMDAGGGAHWEALAAQIVDLALERCVDRRSGAIREHFAADWSPAPGLAGRIVEPGHQFEWAWLLMRWAQRTGNTPAMDSALRLIGIGEAWGVARTREVVVGAVLDDGSVHDPQARLWPQTERIKAACRAAVVTGEARHWHAAIAAVRCLLKYLDTPIRGLWRDRMDADGNFVSEPAPASSFYHLVGAVAELDWAVEQCF